MHRSFCPLRDPALLRAKTLFKLLHTHHLFDQIPQRLPTCPSLPHPIQTIRTLLRSSATLDPTTIAIALKSSRISSGTQIHALAVSSGLDTFVTISNSLMNMYSKSNSFDTACRIFTAIPSPDVVSWNTILAGFTSPTDALDFTLSIRRAGVPPDAVTFTTALAFAAELRDQGFILSLHSLVFKSGLESDTFVGNALITAYSRSDCLDDAKIVFDEMSVRDLVSWNAVISGLTQEGNSGGEAISVFLNMVKEMGLRPDHVSLSSAISACVQDRCIEIGCQLHAFAMKIGFETYVSVSNVLMSMYYKHGDVGCAVTVFDNMRERNLISWTTMISMDTESAVPLFNSMMLDGVQPNDVTFVALMYAVSGEHSEKEGQMIHGVCFKTGISSELNVSNSLITMYAKLGSMEESRKVFDGMGYREIISWNALITGYAQNGFCEEALYVLYSSVLHVKPNEYTFGSILSAITAAESVTMAYGLTCHCLTIKLGLNRREYVSGALIDLYAKRGSVDESRMVFDDTVERSPVSWTAIISAYAKHGMFEVVMQMYGDMVGSAVRPDHITFLAVLTACGCKGMVDSGRSMFETMVLKYKIEPWPEHYACMVDMLGRAGRLVEAEEFVKQIPKGPGLSAMQSLLGACRVHGNLEMGKRAAEALMEMEPTESGAYVLMSNIYADMGDWKNVAKIRMAMRERGVKKEVGFSWVDFHTKDSIYMHKFSSDDNTHPLAEEIYRMAEFMGFEMRSLEEDQRESNLLAYRTERFVSY